MALWNDSRRSRGWLWIAIGIALPLLALWLRSTESGRLTVIYLDCALADAPQLKAAGDDAGGLHCMPPRDDKRTPADNDEAAGETAKSRGKIET